MRSLDTNVLVRYLTADDRSQFEIADRLIQACRDAKEPLFLAVVVICEVIWVLERSYAQPKSAIVKVLEQIIQTDQFRIEQEEIIRRSVASYRTGRGNFADYVIAEVSRGAGCRDVVTFDRKLKSSTMFTVLE
jgi:predicted nucleic-acid-binding protein